MNRSPTLEGFRALLRRPSFGLAEMAWRWSFGAAAGLLLGFAGFEYLDTLPVGRSDMLLLRTAQPTLVARAFNHIFRGSSFRLIAAGVVLALGIAWVIVASLARAATIKGLMAYFHDLEPNAVTRGQGETRNIGALFGLNFLRLGVAIAAGLGFLGAMVLGAAVSRPDDPAPGSALLIMLTVVMLVCWVWCTLNWVLSLAAIFVVTRGKDTFGAIGGAVDLCQARAGSVFAAGTWFGLAHLTAFAVASSIVAFPLGFAGVLPAGVVLGGVLLVSALYFAVADFLYAGRLAAYVAILELPYDPAAAKIVPPALPRPQAPAGVDRDELILSDVPLVWKPAPESGS